MASSGNGPQQSQQHVQGAAEGLFARVKQVASGILAEVSQAGTVVHWNERGRRSSALMLVASAIRGLSLHVAFTVQCCCCNGPCAIWHLPCFSTLCTVPHAAVSMLTPLLVGNFLTLLWLGGTMDYAS
jgi:hypothetical protein